MKNKTKSFSCILLLSIVAIAFVVALACAGCTKAPDVDEENGDFIFSLEAVSVDVQDTRYLSSSSSPVLSTATLTATVTPANATGYTVTWSAAWNTSTSWTSGKTVSNYVSLVPNGSNQLQAIVSALQPFSVPIRVTCSVDDTTLSASCLVGYGQRLTDAGTLGYGSTTLAASSQNVLTADPFVSTSAAPFGSFAESAANRYTLQLAYNYVNTETIQNASVAFYVQPSAGLFSALQSSSMANGQSRAFVACGTGNNVSALYCYNKAIYEALTNKSASSNNQNIVSEVEAFNQAVLANQDAYDFTVKAVVTTDYETMTYTYNVQFDRSNPVYGAPVSTVGYNVEIYWHQDTVAYDQGYEIWINDYENNCDLMLDPWEAKPLMPQRYTDVKCIYFIFTCYASGGFPSSYTNLTINGVVHNWSDFNGVGSVEDPIVVSIAEDTVLDFFIGED